MTFAAPEHSWLLAVVSVAAAISIRSEFRRKKALVAFAEPDLAERICHLPSLAWRVGRTIIFSAALLLAVIALMRPQWGLITEEQTRKGLDIVIALDLSRSMLSDDLKPSRLEAAKAAIRKLLDTLPGDRVGILAFAGTAFTVCPLTSDYAIVARMVDELGPATVPMGGSSISAALNEAQRTFRASPEQGRILILVSDGEDHGGEIPAALQKLRQAKVTVLAAFTGTEEGGLIPLGSGIFVKDRQGAVVKSRGSRATIHSIDPAAIQLQGDATGLESLLQRARSIGGETVRKEHRQRLAERFQWPLAAGLALIGIASLMGRRVTP
ncbi:VWA domain-containing protein [Geobacter pelophilus]|uniref:VWA domain-containing protein n=1 Tax=Geoanaerobacter pelophilus TaxID=60036 RepID=A0AAW4LF82_9BACT|nr:VWA domain-containing protein [Geoanaerobacter pelophilus]MBT0665831.1 VWA domain-containing protein [Geoanaerobacter pelophilus]